MRSICIIAFIVFVSSAAIAQNGTISGRVTFGGTTALHDVSVQVSQTSQSTRTDTEGNYSLTDVPPGRYTVIVHLEGFSDEAKIVTVAAGANVNLDFQLQIASLREQVTVTSSGTEQSVFDSFQTVNSVGSTRITERASTSIGEVLETETGVAKRSFGPGSSRPVIRGFDGDRVLVLQDGLRNGSVGSQSGDHGEPIDPLAAERIEVVKGPATLLYGSNAIGGVVNVIGHHDDDFHDGFRGFLTTVGSTADRQAGMSGGLEYGYRNWLFRGNLGAQRTGDFQTPLGRIPNSAARSNSGSFGTGYYTDKAFFGGAYSFDIRRYGVPFAALFEDHGKKPKEGELPDVDEDIDLRLRRHNVRFSGGFRNLTSPFLSGVKYSVDYTDYRHKEIEIEDGIEEVGTIFDNKIFSFRSVFEQQNYRRLTGRFGFEGFNRDYKVEGEEQLIDGKIRHNSFSVFGLEELNFDRVKFQFGGRVENNRYRAENPELRDRTFTGFSGGAGINIGLWEGGAFIINYTHSNRAPALEELYNNGPHIGNVTFEIGNENLVRETANGIDFALRHFSNRFRFFGDIYYYRINNFVFLAPQDEDGDGDVDIEDGLPVARYEQENASYFGAELNAEARFNDYIGGFVSLDMVRANLINEDINIPRIPPARARVGLDLRYRNLSVRPEAVFASAQTRTYPLETPTAGYGIINVGGSYTIGRQHHAHIFTFNAYNLTNRLYRNHVNFIKDLMPEIGRGIRVGYTIRIF
jgi:iron complex outermembrane receptor protein